MHLFLGIAILFLSIGTMAAALAIVLQLHNTIAKNLLLGFGTTAFVAIMLFCAACGLAMIRVSLQHP